MDPVAYWQKCVLVVLIITVFVGFVREWLSPELLALSALFVCIAIGILPVSDGSAYDALSVFGHPAPIVVACMFILSAALERTGVIEALGAWFERVAATGPRKMLIIMMVVAAALSGFVNNTPVVVVFMPLVLAVCRQKSWTASKYLIPLSYAAIVGGTMTIIGTSTNLIAAEIAKQRDMEAFSMFEITPLGGIFVVVTFFYMLAVGQRLLPERVTLSTLLTEEEGREYITHAFVAGGSTLVGKRLSESALKGNRRLRVIEIRRAGSVLNIPLKDVIFEEGDEVFFKGRSSDLAELMDSDDLRVRDRDDLEGLSGVSTESAMLIEGILGPQSSLVGRTLKGLNFRQRYGVIILAVHRQGKNLRERFEDVRLAFGDTLLVQGPASRIQQLFMERDFINLSEPKGQPLRRSKAPIAIGAIAGFAIIAMLGEVGLVPKIPVVTLAIGAALLTLVTGCMRPQDAYAAIEWKVIFLIFGMLGLGLALDRSELAGQMARALVGWIGDNPHLMLAGIYLMAAVMTEIISNNAVAALLTPLAIVIGFEMGVDPRAFVVAVMFGSSASFSTPIGYQTNTFVYGAGGYKFADFFKVGAPLAVLLWLTASYVIPLIWPFY